MTPWVSSCCSLVSGRFTSAAGFTIADVVIMKMMRSTRKTSVSGVMLISATMWPRRCALPNAIGLSPSVEERLDHARASDLERGVDPLHARLEEVVEHDREDADGEAERGRDERLRDAARDDAEAAGPGDRHRVEGPDDPHHRAEEADERRRRRDRAEHPEVRAGVLRLLELALVGDALELGALAPGLGEDVGVDPPRG